MMRSTIVTDPDVYFDEQLIDESVVIDMYYIDSIICMIIRFAGASFDQLSKNPIGPLDDTPHSNSPVAVFRMLIFFETHDLLLVDNFGHASALPNHILGARNSGPAVIYGISVARDGDKYSFQCESNKFRSLSFVFRRFAFQERIGVPLSNDRSHEYIDKDDNTIFDYYEPFNMSSLQKLG